MIPPLNALHGYASPELEQACGRTVELAERLAQREARLTAMVGLWACRFVQGQMPTAYALAEQILALVGDRGARVGQAQFSLGGAALHLGLPAAARQHFATALASMSEESLSVGTRARVHTAAWAAHAEWTCGRPEAAADLMVGAVAEARATGHQYSLAVALAFAAITDQLLGDRAAVGRDAAELRRLCDRCAFAYYGDWGRILEGWCRGGPAGRELARQGIANLHEQGAHARRPYWLSLLADVETDPVARCRVLDEALAAAAQQHEHWWLAEVLRQRARYDPDGGTTRLRAAAGLARRQGSAALLERCESTLADLAGAVGER